MTSTDSEVIAHLIVTAPGRDWGERMAYVMRRAQGAFCLTILTKEGVIAARDPLGIRPLSPGDASTAASASPRRPAPSTILGATFIRDVEPGETILLNERGHHSFKLPG